MEGLGEKLVLAPFLTQRRSLVLTSSHPLIESGMGDREDLEGPRKTTENLGLWEHCVDSNTGLHGRACNTGRGGVMWSIQWVGCMWDAHWMVQTFLLLSPRYCALCHMKVLINWQTH